MNIFYFGCIKQAGHYCWMPDGSSIRHHNVLPEEIAKKIDTSYCPHRAAGGPEGVARLTHELGYTILSFRDSSVDSRPGSHSTFVCDEVLCYEDMMERCRHHFKHVFVRYKFEIVPEGGPPEGVYDPAQVQLD